MLIQISSGYGKLMQKLPCQSCRATLQHRVSKTRIDQFPRVMELRLEFQTEQSKNVVQWNELSLPKYLTWAGVQYKFTGMILRDWTIKHFSSIIEIDDQLYYHDGFEGGLLRRPNATFGDDQMITLAAAIGTDNDILPITFYYIMVDVTDGIEDWI